MRKLILRHNCDHTLPLREVFAEEMKDLCDRIKQKREEEILLFFYGLSPNLNMYLLQ